MLHIYVALHKKSTKILHCNIDVPPPYGSIARIITTIMPNSADTLMN
jgi:hypothetical protein